MDLLASNPASIPFDVVRRPWLRVPTIRVEMDDRVIVTVPVTARRRFIESFIKEKAHWIRRRFEENAKIRRRFPARRYVSGERWPLQGKAVTLIVAPGRGRAFLDDDGFLSVPVAPSSPKAEASQVRSKLISFYRERARALVREPLKRYAAKLDLPVPQYRVNNARTLWGSSTSRGTLNFTNRLAMAPEHVIEYLVVHELSHQRQMNHSKAFWELVGSVCPRYKEAERWLKDTGRWLEL